MISDHKGGGFLLRSGPWTPSNVHNIIQGKNCITHPNNRTCEGGNPPRKIEKYTMACTKNLQKSWDSVANFTLNHSGKKYWFGNHFPLNRDSGRVRVFLNSCNFQPQSPRNPLFTSPLWTTTAKRSYFPSNSKLKKAKDLYLGQTPRDYRFDDHPLIYMGKNGS